MNHPDYSKIPYPGIVRFFREAGIESSSELVPVCYNGNNGEYMEHQLNFTIEASLDKVWNTYRSIHPFISWNTNMIRLAFVYSRGEDQYIYQKEEKFPGLKKGQIFVVNLRVIRGVEITVAHEIDEVNEKDHVIKVCYLNTGKTAGSQWIKLKDTGDGKTKIDHLTLYKGTSFIRDRLLYPYFHEKAMNQFHQKMSDLITNASSSQN